MTNRDRVFACGTALSALMPVMLWLGGPIAEARATLGYFLGWTVAAAVIVPSFVLMRAVMDTDSQMRFQQAFIGSMMARMLISLLAVAAVALLMSEPPLKSFLTTFFSTYMLLSGLEVILLSTPRYSRTHREPA